MNVSFIITLDLPNSALTSLDGQAQDIQDSLSLDGIPVIEVKPWSRPSLGTPSPLSFPTSVGVENTETEQTNIQKTNRL